MRQVLDQEKRKKKKGQFRFVKSISQSCNLQQLLMGLGNVAQWSKAGEFSLQTTVHRSPHKQLVARLMLGFMSKIGTYPNII